MSVPWEWVLIFAFFITFLENIFPPAPCDSILVFTGGLVGIGTVSMAPLLIVATLGSTVGFIAMYYLGRKFGISIIDSKRFKFVSRKEIEKPERLFNKYGDWIIVANRFLSGTRAIISFFAGISKLKIGKTVLLSALSALAWNSILIYAGYLLGDNWEQATEYFALYGKILTIAIVIAIAIAVLLWYRKKKKTRD
jgi:membrane protein DedA with SNARE-associated domain